MFSSPTRERSDSLTHLEQQPRKAKNMAGEKIIEQEELQVGHVSEQTNTKFPN